MGRQETPPFTPHQPLVDGKHSVICGHAALRCAARTKKKSTVETLTLQGIQSLLIFSLVSATSLSDKPCSSVLFSDPISVRTKVSSTGIVTNRRTAKMPERRGRTVPLNLILLCSTGSVCLCTVISMSELT